MNEYKEEMTPGTHKLDFTIMDEIRAINMGLGLMSAYFLLEFGSFQGLYPIFSTLRIPFLVASLSVIYAIYCLISGQSKYNYILVTCLLYLLAISLFMTVDPYAKETVVTLFITYVCYYIISINSVRNTVQLVLLLDAFLASVAYSCFHGIMQGGLVWSNQWLGDENQMSVICIITLPLAYYMYMSSANRIKRYCYVICMCLYFTLIVVSMSRGGLLSLAVVSFLIWLKSNNKLRSTTLMIVALIVIAILAPPKLMKELEEISVDAQEGSPGERMYLWKLSYHMFKDAPVLGIGLNNFGELFVEYDRKSERRDKMGGVTWRGHKWVMHSTPMTIITETGIVGCLIFIQLQIMLYRNARQKTQPGNKDGSAQRNLANAVLLSEIGFWTGSMFLSLLITPFFWVVVIFSEAIRNTMIFTDKASMVHTA